MQAVASELQLANNQQLMDELMILDGAKSS
jgi:hypothetical protein